ncbi:MAG: amidohydrolase family protein [Syntrophales bacterium LBB04]|nr:amidohydrolase family protein [Syntrophales bacterium LBB04]
MGIIAGGNNDCPITFYGSFVQMYAAVTRKTSSGKVIGPEEAISLMEAIRLYTWNGAYLAKEEDRPGQHRAGKAGGSDRHRPGYSKSAPGRTPGD